MKSAPIALRPWLACLVLGIAVPVGGCGPGENDQAPAPINQEATKKSMEATGNFYKQQHQKKAPADAKGAAPADAKGAAPADAKGAAPAPK